METSFDFFFFLFLFLFVSLVSFLHFLYLLHVLCVFYLEEKNNKQKQKNFMRKIKSLGTFFSFIYSLLNYIIIIKDITVFFFLCEKKKI